MELKIILQPILNDIRHILYRKSKILPFDNNNAEDYPFCIEENVYSRINPDYYLKNTDKTNVIIYRHR